MQLENGANVERRRRVLRAHNDDSICAVNFEQPRAVGRLKANEIVVCRLENDDAAAFVALAAIEASFCGVEGCKPRVDVLKIAAVYVQAVERAADWQRVDQK